MLMAEDLLELAATADETEVPSDETDQVADETGVTSGETDGTEDGTGAAPVTSLFESDGQKLNPAIKALLGEIKTKNPSAEKLLSKAIYRHAELMREFPAGLTEARELRDKVEEFGGVEGIEEQLQAAAQLDGLAGAFEKADPAFVQDLVESYPESFKALGPVFANEYAKADPEGFQSYIGRIFYGDMAESGFLLTFQRLADFLPADNQKAKETYVALFQYLQGLQELSKKPVKNAQPRQDAPKNEDLDRREQELRAREWKTERETVHKSFANAAYNEALAGRKPDGEEKAQISELFLSRAGSLTKKLFPDAEKKLNGYIARNDKAGYFRYLKSIYQRVIPTAVQSAVGSTMKDKAAATATARPGGAIQPKQKTAAPAGFVPVAKTPRTFDIDYVLTTKAMLEQNRAILKGGMKVTWR